MKIAISGFTGCGKTTAGRLVAKALGFSTIETTFKELAAKKGIPLMEFQGMARKDEKIDRELDNYLRAEAGKGNCVVMTWLSPWILPDAGLKVWLDAPQKERARRVSRREGMTFSSALLHVKSRDAQNIARYKKVYGIDIREHSGFDLVIGNEKLSAEETAKIILAAAKMKLAKKN